MIKICIVTPYVMKGDGQGRANYEIVWEALRRGYHVTLVARKVDADLAAHNQINWVCFSVENWPTALLQEVVFSQQSSRWLNKHRHEFDLVQVYGAVTMAKGDVNTAQFIHTAWLRSPAHTHRVNRNLYGFYHWLYTTLNARWEQTAFRQAQVAIAVSQIIKNELIHDIGLKSEQIRVILNGVDTNEFIPGKIERNQFGLPEDVTIALFAGDIRTNRKNLDTVLRGLVEVENLHLAVIGNTEGSPYPALATSLGLGDRVHFLGFRSDIARVMQAVDFFVFPSRYEPFGMVVIEAMACGLPVITAASTGASEVVTSESGIVISNSEDVQALALALKRLSDDTETRQTMGLVARKIAEQNAWVNKAQAYIDLFEEIVNDAHHRHSSDVSSSPRPQTLLGSA